MTDGVDETRKVAVVLTRLASAEALAATCALHKIIVDAVSSSVGAYAVCREVTGESPALLAAAVSNMVKSVPIMLFEATGSHIAASRWQGGELIEEVPAALVLGSVPNEVEDLLLGAVTVAELPGVVTSQGLSRWKALRTLAALGRASRGKG